MSTAQSYPVEPGVGIVRPERASPNGSEPDPGVLNIDLDHLTVEEIEQIEELTGAAIDTFGQPGQPKGKMMRAMGLIVTRRTDPGFTWEQAGKLRVEFGSKPVPPTSGGG